VVAGLLAMYVPQWTPRSLARAWVLEARTLLDRSYLDHRAAVAAQSARSQYAVPVDLLLAIGRSPVAVDNVDTSAVWAYGLAWRPAPVFQQPSAYTVYLDQLNAKSIVDAGHHQLILRATESIDGRNPLWDPPRYVLAELCHYRPAGHDSKWLLLRRASDRCAGMTGAGTRRVVAGQSVPVPVADPNQAVIMSFSPSVPSLPERAVRLLYKPRHPLYVHVSGASSEQDFRLPRALATGPLIVRFPASAGWPAAFGGTGSYNQVAFTESGTVTFRLVAVR
jgi:hypothetical protein